jgi:two-component sensor histidine kinase
VGAITSEFVMNSFKHAFPGERPGTVKITLSDAGSQIHLICRDDGVGAANIAVSKRGLGLRLIEAYAGQIGGAAKFRDADPGVELRVTFRRD